MTMNRIKILGFCALLSVVLTACGTKDVAQEDANQMVAQTDMSGNAAVKGNEPRATLNPNAMLMMTAFRGLIQMDQAEGLAITKEQAEPMITIVQDVIAKNELNAEVQTKLEANLTADQKKFLTENAAKTPQRNGNGQRPAGGTNGDAPQGGANGDAPQGGANGDAPQGGANGDTPQGGANGDTPQGGANGDAPQGGGKGGGRGGGGGGNFQNTGPQLLELLQAKLK